MTARRGFVLLSVLWFLAGVTSLALAAMLMARGALSTASNRIALTRAEWRAEECMARTLAAMTTMGRAQREPWTGRVGGLGAVALRETVLNAPSVADCPGTVELEPFGAGVPLASVRESMFARMLRAHGIPAAAADSLTDAFLDWRDADDSARTFGAEHDWYIARGEPAPRNGPLASVDELRSIRGFADWMGEDGNSGLVLMMRADSGRVFLDAAPLAVLGALPGITPLAAAVLEQRRRSGAEPLPELLSIIGIIPEDSRAVLERAFTELADAVTVTAEGWVVRARSSGDQLDPRADRLLVEIEQRLVPDGRRLAVTQRRISP